MSHNVRFLYVIIDTIKEILELSDESLALFCGDYVKKKSDIRFCMKYPNCKFCPLSRKCERELEKKEAGKK